MSMYPSADKMKMSTPTCFPGRYSPTYRGPDQMRRCMTNPSSRFLEDASIMCNSWSPRHNGDIFSGLNDGILSRAEALAAVDIGKHQSSHPHSQMTSQLKHDVMYHHSMSAPPQRPLQVSGYQQVHRAERAKGVGKTSPSQYMSSRSQTDSRLNTKHRYPISRNIRLKS